MIGPDAPGGPSPLRVAGFALLGIAAVAFVIGLATLAGQTDNTAAPSTPVPSVATSSTSTSPSPSVSVPPASSALPSAPAVAPLPAAAPVRAPLRVYNNSTIRGLAAKAADDFRAAGWPVETVSNYPSGVLRTSTVYFQPGTGQEVAAQTLANEFGLRVAPRFAGLADASPGIIVIVTNDYQRR